MLAFDCLSRSHATNLLVLLGASSLDWRSVATPGLGVDEQYSAETRSVPARKVAQTCWWWRYVQGRRSRHSGGRHHNTYASSSQHLAGNAHLKTEPVGVIDGEVGKPVPMPSRISLKLTNWWARA